MADCDTLTPKQRAFARALLTERDVRSAALLAEIAELQPAVDVAELLAQQARLLDEIAEYQPELPDPEELAEQQRALLDEIAAALV